MLAEYRTPMVVFGNSTHPRRAVPEEKWKELAAITPSEKSDWQDIQWIPKSATRLLPGGQSRPGADLPTATHDGKSVSILKPGKSLVTPLPVDQYAAPHRIIIKTPVVDEVKTACNLLVEVSGDPSFRSSSTKLMFPATPPPLAAFAKTDRPNWRKQNLLIYPQDDEQFLRITNLSEKSNQQLRSVIVASGPTRLTESDPRSKGEALSKSPSRRAGFRLRNLGWADSLTSDVHPGDYAPQTLALHRLVIATDRLADHAHLVGWNTLVVPLADSDGRVAWDDPSQFPRRLDHIEDGLRMRCFLRQISGQGLDVMLSLNLATFVQRSLGIQTAPPGPIGQSSLTGNDGRVGSAPGTSAGSSAGLRLLDPMARRQLQRSIESLAAQCGVMPNVRGLLIDDLPDDVSASTVTDFSVYQSFAQQSRSEIPLNRIPSWCQNEGRKPFETWIEASTASFYSSLLDILPPGHELVFRSEPRAIKTWRTLAANDPLLQRIVVLSDRRRGTIAPWNLDITKERNLDLAHTGRGRHRSPVGQATSHPSDPSRSQIGSGIVLGQVSTDNDQLTSNQTPKLAHDVAQSIRFFDPVMILVESQQGLGPDCTSVDRSVTRAFKEFLALPKQSMRRISSVAPDQEAIQLRWGVREDRVLLWAVNMAPWPSVMIVKPRTGFQFNDHDPTDQSLESGGISRDGTIRKRLDAFDTLLLSSPIPRNLSAGGLNRSDAPAPIQSWKCTTNEIEVDSEAIKALVGEIVAKMGQLALPEDYPRLINGGFEQDSAVGISGWMHTQHPANAVSVDSSEALVGSRSLRMTSDPRVLGRTWIVSENIPPPVSGRLAVSLAVRGALMTNSNESAVPRSQSGTDPNARKSQPPSSPSTGHHKLRVSLEATRRGIPIRHSSVVEVARDGKWHPRTVALEATGIGRQEIDSLRLTIDSLSPGTVWIDDVHLHHLFPLKNERTELQNAVFLAVRGLQNQNLTHAARLLQNEWALQLLRQPRQESTPTPPRETPAALPAEPPSVADRIKDWIPKPLRF